MGGRATRAREGERHTGGGTIGAFFTDGDDYVTELEQDKELIERGVVRVQRCTRASGDGSLTEVFVEASAIVDGRLVRLSQPEGTLYGVGGADEQVLERAREDLDWLRGELGKLGLDVRAGAWTER